MLAARLKRSNIAGMETLTSDNELVDMCRSGDDAAMYELYTRHSGRIYSMAFRFLGNRADADEIVQDCFLKAWSNLSRFRGDSAVGTWLYRIAVNLCRDKFKKRKPTEPQADVAFEGDYQDTFAKARIESALKLLPNRYREVLVLHDVMEMRHHEIADILGIAVGTSKSQLHKGRAQMRQILKKRGIKSSI